MYLHDWKYLIFSSFLKLPKIQEGIQFPGVRRETHFVE